MAIRQQRQLARFDATIERRFGLMGEPLVFATNDRALMAAAEASFGRYPLPATDREPLIVRLFRDAAGARAPARDRPDVPVARTLVHRSHGRHLFIAHDTDQAIVDVLAGEAVGFVGPATADDMAAVRYSFVEAMALSLLHGRGYLVLHASGVARNGIGICLQGAAGAGKSTLAVACARRGYAVFADDAVFVRAGRDSFEVWGLPWTQRLLPDAGSVFPELAGYIPRRQPNGEWKVEVDLDEAYPGRATPSAAAGPLVVIVRGGGGPTRVEAIEPGESELEILVPWEVGWTDAHERVLKQLEQWPTYRLHVNGSPDEAVDALDELLAGRPASLITR